jgi:Leucine-rich repeat (LRR) protein
MKLHFCPRYSLRTLVVLFTALNVWLGLNASRAHKQRVAVDGVNKLGGTVYHDYQLRMQGTKINLPAGSSTGPGGSVITWGASTLVVVNERNSYMLDHVAPAASPVPAWLRTAGGDEMFIEVVAVHLEDTQVTDDDVRCLEGLPSVRVLNLSRTKITDKALALLSGLENLEALTLDGTAIDGSGLAHLEHLPRLEELSLAGCSITDAGLKSTLAPKRLKSITLDDTTISDIGLAYLRSAVQLTTVSLSHTSVRGPGLRHLNGAQVETLRLAYAPIGDDGLSDLTHWPKLRSLSLEHSSLTDVGLESLKGLVSLQELRLPWVAHRTTNISTQAARRIEKALPKTRISFPP